MRRAKAASMNENLKGRDNRMIERFDVLCLRVTIESLAKDECVLELLLLNCR